MQEMDRVKKLIILTFIGFVIFFIGRIALYIVNFESFKDISLGTTILAFLHGFRFDAAILMTFFCPIIVLLLLPINNKIYYKIVMWLAFVIYLFFIILIAIDINYFKESTRHLTDELILLRNDKSFIFQAVKLYYIQAIFLFLFIIVLGNFYNKFINIKSKNFYFRKKNLLKQLGIFIIAGILVAIMIRGSFDWKPIAPINAFVLNNIEAGNLTLNGPFTTFIHLRDNNGNKIPNYVFFNNDTYAKEKIASLKGKVHHKPNNMPKNANIVYILLEGINELHISEEVTPNLYKMREEGLHYTNHFSPTRRSIAALTATLGGIAPLTGIPYLGFGLESIVKGLDLCSELRRAGYQTIMMQSSYRNSYYVDQISNLIGCNEYYGREDFPRILNYPNQDIVWGPDYEMFNFLAKRIKKFKKNERFFSFLFTASTHIPYLRLEESMEIFKNKDGERDGFKNALHYADYGIGELIKELETDPSFDNTVFIISADHCSTGSSIKEDYNIPLIIWYKGVKHNEVDFVSSHIDMPATVLDVAGLYDNRSKYVGDSIFYKDNNSFAVLNRGSIATIFRKEEYLTSSLKDVIEYSPKDMDNKTKEELEELIKAYYEAQYRKITGR